MWGRTRLIAFGCLGLLVGLPFVTWATVIERIGDSGDEEYYIDEQVSGEQIFLGELTGEPHMYVVTFNEVAPLSLILNADNQEESPNFSVMVVKDALLRGVESIARLPADDSDWTEVHDARTRVTYRSGHKYQTELAAGTYRIEVSTPINQGRYELRFGAAEHRSWWQSVQTMRALQRWYEVSWWRSIFSFLIYVPLIITLLMGGAGWLGYRRWHQYGKIW